MIQMSKFYSAGVLYIGFISHALLLDRTLLESITTARNVRLGPLLTRVRRHPIAHPTALPREKHPASTFRMPLPLYSIPSLTDDYCRLLYPTEFNVPADSDYDDQDQDAFEPIDTQLMPKSLQDPKLRFDYTRLPDMP